jgi:hypothetical protein
VRGEFGTGVGDGDRSCRREGEPDADCAVGSDASGVELMLRGALTKRPFDSGKVSASSSESRMAAAFCFFFLFFLGSAPVVSASVTAREICQR